MPVWAARTPTKPTMATAKPNHRMPRQIHWGGGAGQDKRGGCGAEYDGRGKEDSSPPLGRSCPAGQGPEACSSGATIVDPGANPERSHQPGYVKGECRDRGGRIHGHREPSS